MGILVSLILSSSLSNSEPTEGDPATIVVPDDFPTIQEAINNAADGDTVFVKSGTYYEHVIINKTLSLTGENCTTTIIDGNWTGVVINVTRSGINVSGLTVRRSGSIYWENAGIYLDNAEDCSINGSILTENPFAGLELANSRRCVVSGNTILNNSGVGITMVGGGFNDLSQNNIMENGWSAVTLNDEAHNNTISGNNMTSNNLAVIGHCINLYRSSNNSIQKNNIAGDDNGIRLEYWSNCNTIAENRFTDNTETGVSVEAYSDNNTFSGNLISGSRFGFMVRSSRYTEIFNNTITHNYGSDWDAGIRLESAAYTRIHSNEITDNWRGILLYTASPNVSIAGNNLTNNRYAVRVASGGSSHLNVSGNLIVNNSGYGVGVTGFGSSSNYAVISKNTITSNGDGIAFGQGSNYNTVYRNNISENAVGFYIEYSTQNLIYNNNVVNNTQQVHVATGSSNAWNSNYASGGNFWSDCTGPDCRSGPSQNLTGCDGFGDTPHVLNTSNVDNYPFMKPIPWDASDIGITCLGKVGSQGVSTMKTVVGEDTTVHFSVFIMNYGSATETFNVTAYANSTWLGSQTGLTITSKSCAIANFTWDTSAFEEGSYAISVQITAVPGETDTNDNSFDCAVAIGVVGDVDYNGIVNMLDIYNVALSFGALVGQASYVSNCDIDDNGIINMLDLWIAATHFGQSAR